VTHERADRHVSTTRAGFAVLAVAIRREPWIFTLSTVGSLLFGALTVADAWVLGWSADHVVGPGGAGAGGGGGGRGPGPPPQKGATRAGRKEQRGGG
jgi:hypothetical protein